MPLHSSKGDCHSFRHADLGNLGFKEMGLNQCSQLMGSCGWLSSISALLFQRPTLMCWCCFLPGICTLNIHCFVPEGFQFGFLLFLLSPVILRFSHASYCYLAQRALCPLNVTVHSPGCLQLPLVSVGCPQTSSLSPLAPV